VSLVLKGGTVWTATGAAPIENATIVIEDRRIARIDRDGQAPIPSDADVRDVSGMFVLPGLIDSHNHLGLAADSDIHAQVEDPEARVTTRAIRRAWQHLRDGVTTMRLCGERGFMDVAWREAFASDLLPGPRLVVSGPAMAARHGHMANAQSWIVNGTEEMREAVRTNFRNGADFIKLAISGSRATRWTQPRGTYFTRAEIQTAIDEAHRSGSTVTAHCHGGQGLIWALEAGLDCIEHGANFTDEEIDRVVEAGIPQVVTLGVYFDAHDPPVDALDHIHPRYQPSFEATGKAYRAGVPQAVGGDTRHGRNNLVFELRCLKKCGVSNEDALLAATRRGAQVCRLDGEIGTLELGKLADILVVGRNPLDDIDALRDVRLVLKEGRTVMLPEETAVRSLESAKAGAVY
jgi:imidazolonepropionase-like amidohydrolase